MLMFYSPGLWKTQVWNIVSNLLFWIWQFCWLTWLFKSLKAFWNFVHFYVYSRYIRTSIKFDLIFFLEIFFWNHHQINPYICTAIHSLAFLPIWSISFNTHYSKRCALLISSFSMWISCDLEKSNDIPQFIQLIGDRVWIFTQIFNSNPNAPFTTSFCFHIFPSGKLDCLGWQVVLVCLGISWFQPWKSHV